MKKTAICRMDASKQLAMQTSLNLTWRGMRELKRLKTSIAKLVPGCAKFSLFLARFRFSFRSNMVKNAKMNQLIEHVKAKLK